MVFPLTAGGVSLKLLKMITNSEILVRNTRQRQVILEELRKVKSHPTAEDVYEMVRRRLPRVSLGTVYRNLELLAEAGTIQKIGTAGTRKRFDGNPRPHYHLRCLSCERVSDVEMEPDHRLDRDAEALSGFTVIGHSLEFCGFCPACRKKSPGREDEMVDTKPEVTGG